MAASASVNISASVSGGIVNRSLNLPTIANSPTTDAISLLVCSTGFNSISPPTNAVGVIILPPAANTVTLTLKGVTGDTGVGLHLTNPSCISLAGLSAFGITTNGSVTLDLFWF